MTKRMNPIPATISIPRGYVMLKPNAIKRKGDMELVRRETADPSVRTVGDWHPVECVGESVDFAGNHTIRPVRRKATRRPVRVKVNQPYLAQLAVLLADWGFKRSDNLYERQEPYGDHTTVEVLANGRVRIAVRCWNPGDGWSDETLSARDAVAHFTI